MPNNENKKVNLVKFNRGLITENKESMVTYIEKYNKVLISVKEYKGFKRLCNQRTVEVSQSAF